MGRKNKSLILSDKAYRRLIGILGMALPLVCFAGGAIFAGYRLQSSISSYYHTNVRDFFVGLMFALSLFLVTYKGHERIDTVVDIVTGFAGLSLALFPCLGKDAKDPIGFFQLPPVASDLVHVCSAGAFFFLLAFTATFLFTRSSQGRHPRGPKLTRNVIYVVCGCLMFAGLACLIVLRIFFPAALEDTSVVFWIETLMLEAFGISWLVKGETLFRDPKDGKANASFP
jgi:hypothetical protein